MKYTQKAKSGLNRPAQLLSPEAKKMIQQRAANNGGGGHCQGGGGW